MPLLSLDMFKAKLKDQSRIMMETIELLIREHKITPEMGTSLMNDSAYVYDIQANLISMAATVFINRTGQSIDVEQGMSLSDSELSEVVNRVSE